jgi:hypothetical protein
MIDVVFWPFATYCDCDRISGELSNPVSKAQKHYCINSFVLLPSAVAVFTLPNAAHHTCAMGISRDAFSFMPFSVA